ncbi:MAG TPA: hypothetical protein VFU23_00135 [Gemmatimonadales bacterium]|nr:hypothetical protein [Gemmatimonadales bacterium]
MTAPKKPVEEVPAAEQPQLPEIEGTPLPDELTGRASKTNDDLADLFENQTEEHITDGFRGGSGEDEPGT